MSARSVLLVDEDHVILTVDSMTRNLVVLDTIHYRVHIGEMFQVDKVSLAVANNASSEILIRVPSNGSAHMAFTIRAGGDTRLQLFEGPTVTGDGVSIPTVNRNRFSSKVTGILAFHTPTVADDGVPLSSILSAGGTGGNSAGGDASSFSEWVLKSDTDYLMKGTNVAGTAQNIGLEVYWYQIGASAP